MMGSMEPTWPTSERDLEAGQIELASVVPAPWSPTASPTVAGVWFTVPRGSSGTAPGEPAWAAAVSIHQGTIVGESIVRGHTGAGYHAGYLALREGPSLGQAVLALRHAPDALLVNATGRDHPRRAGLALHLGTLLQIPTIGVTDRPLLATGAEPSSERWATAELELKGEAVAVYLRTRRGARPVVVHPGWRTDLTVAIDVVRRVTERARTPEPLRAARRNARLARARDEGRIP
jgi:deoxyribonuclease V